jgi:hypothetical protein
MQRTTGWSIVIAVSIILLCRSTHADSVRSDELEGDERLTRSVRFEWRHLPLDEALADMMKQASVVLRIEGEAADLRITGFASHQPLNQVMRRLALLLQLTWRRTGSGDKSEYTLYASPKDREVVQREKTAEWERFRANIRRLILAVTRPEALGNDPLDRAARSVVDFTASRTTVGLLAGLPDAVLDRVFQGGTVRIPFASLSPLQQEALRGFRAVSHAEIQQRAVEAGRKPSTAEPEPIEQGGLELEVMRKWGDGERSRLRVGTWGRSHGGGGTAIGLDPSASLSVEDQLRIPRHFGSRDCSLTPLSTLRLPPVTGSWEDAVVRFAQENQIPVLSEAFDSDQEIRLVDPPPAGTPIAGILDRLCLPYDQTWNAAEPILLFHQRDWYLERDRQIPERLARHWRQLARMAGVYPISELARMAAMTQGQRAKLWKYAGDDAVRMTIWHHDALLLYGALRPEQRAQAAGEGLPVDQLDVAQQGLLPPVVEKLRPGPLDLSRSFRRLEVRETLDERIGTITLVFRDGERRTVQLDRRATPKTDAWSFRFRPAP